MQIIGAEESEVHVRQAGKLSKKKKEKQKKSFYCFLQPLGIPCEDCVA
jgi:hypothetical protein